MLAVVVSMAVFPGKTQLQLALPKREPFHPSPIGLACQDWSGVHCNFSLQVTPDVGLFYAGHDDVFYTGPCATGMQPLRYLPVH